MYNVVNISEYSSLVKKTIELTEKWGKTCVLYAEGRPGIGKTSVAERVARESGRKLYTIRLAQCDLSDINVYMPDEGRLKQYMTELLPREPNVVLFLDEYKLATRSLRHVIWELLEKGRLGNYTLPDKTPIIIASNLDDDLNSEGIESPENGRFFFKIRVEPSDKEFDEYFSTRDNGSYILGYCKAFPEDKTYTEPETGISAVNPREWDKITHLPKEELELAMNILPSGINTKFLAFINQANLFKDLEAYMNGKTPFPNEIDKQCALYSAILGHIKTSKRTEELIDIIFDMRFKADEEIKAMIIIGTIRLYKEKLHAKTIIDAVLKIKDPVKKEKIINVLKQYQYLSPTVQIN